MPNNHTPLAVPTAAPTAAPASGRYVVTDAEVRKVFGHPDTAEALVPHYLGAPLSVVVQPIADRAYAAVVASVNVPEIERAAAYRAVREVFNHGSRFVFTQQNALDWLAKYAPAPEPEPWREWVRPSDGQKYRTDVSGEWHRQFGMEWQFYSLDHLPTLKNRADAVSVVEFLAAHFPQEVTP